MTKSLRVLLVVSAVGMASAAEVPNAAADAGAGGVAAAPAPAPAPARKAGPRAVVGGKRVVKAGGDSRAWATLKPILPDSVTLVAQVNVAAIRGSESFAQLKRLVVRDGDLHEVFDAARQGCQLDLGEVIQDVVFVNDDGDGGGHSVFAVSFKGVVESDLTSCVEAAAAKQHGGAPRVEAHRAGGITEYTLSGNDSKVYAAWLAPDVVVFPSGVSDRAALVALIGQKGGLAGTPVARRAFAAVPPGAAGFLVYLKAEKIESYDLKLAAASLTIAGGRLGFDLSLVLADADSARRAAADWAAQRDQLAAGGGSVPALIGQMLKAVQIAASDDVVRVTASVAEKDFLGAFPLF